MGRGTAALRPAQYCILLTVSVCLSCSPHASRICRRERQARVRERKGRREIRREIRVARRSMDSGERYDCCSRHLLQQPRERRVWTHIRTHKHMHTHPRRSATHQPALFHLESVYACVCVTWSLGSESVCRSLTHSVSQSSQNSDRVSMQTCACTHDCASRVRSSPVGASPAHVNLTFHLWMREREREQTEICVLFLSLILTPLACLSTPAREERDSHPHSPLLFHE